jgi:hypothetical protein
MYQKLPLASWQSCVPQILALCLFISFSLRFRYFGGTGPHWCILLWTCHVHVNSCHLKPAQQFLDTYTFLHKEDLYSVWVFTKAENF